MAIGSILLAALGIGLLIFVHELGHFLAARAAGVRVEVFSLGFGPRLLGFVWRGTDFRLSAVPFGGFVMVAGQDPSDRRYPKHESLYAKSAGQRTLFWSGGVVMNVLFALIAFPLVFRAGVAFTAPVIGGVDAGGAAWEAGLVPGDRVLEVAGREMLSFDNVHVEVALAGGRPVPLRVRGGDGQERTVTVLPQYDPANGIYQLGISGPVAPALPAIEVTTGGAAARAGLKNGDLLVAIDGTPSTGSTLEAVFAKLERTTDEPAEVRVRRGELESTYTIAPLPAAVKVPPRIGVGQLPRVVVGLRQGVPFLERLGLQRGDVLLAVDGAPFVSGDLAVARSGPDPLRVHVRRDGREVMLAAAASAADRELFATSVGLTFDESLMLLPTQGRAAALAGLRAGDRIASVDGQPVRSLDDLRNLVEAASERSLLLEVRRAGTGPRASWLDPATGDLPLDERVELRVTPRRQALYDLGFVPLPTELSETIRAASFGEALALGSAQSLHMIKQIYVTLKRMVTGDVGAKNLGGIIRISQVSYQAAQRGPSWFFYLLAMLSLNLAVVNLLPIPVLDGGHLLFVLIEKVKGSPVSSRVFGYSQVLGLVFVLMLVLFVTYNDILRLL